MPSPNQEWRLGEARKHTAIRIYVELERVGFDPMVNPTEEDVLERDTLEYVYDPDAHASQQEFLRETGDLVRAELRRRNARLKDKQGEVVVLQGGS